MPINLAHSIQIMLAATVGAFFGNLLSITLSKRFFYQQQGIQHENIFEAILASVKIGLYVSGAVLMFIVIDLLFALGSINISFLKNQSSIGEFLVGLFVTNIGSLEQAFKLISTENSN